MLRFLGRRTLTVAGLGLGLLFGSGCVAWAVCSGEDYEVFLMWPEPGLYEEFPPPPAVEDYRITWQNASLSEAAFKIAEAVIQSNNSAGLSDRWLSVNASDAALWHAAHDDVPLDDETTRQLALKTFEELGLTEPKNLPAKMDWIRDCA